MGLVTFTLEWHADVDLDLWFFCKQDNDKVYYGDKRSETCDAKLDVDMLRHHINNVREAGDVGQLENLYGNTIVDGDYEFAVHYFSGNETVNYKLYVTRDFCGRNLAPHYDG